MGSGRFTWRPIKPESSDVSQVFSADELEDDANKIAERASYESELSNYFQDLLQDYNDRDIEGIRNHLEDIKRALEDVEVIDLLYGGSVSKWTYINGLSDVDVLAVLSDEAYYDKTPDEMLTIFIDRLQRDIPDANISKGNLAVTIEFDDGHIIQVLPTIRTKDGVRIANPDTNTWSNVIRPARFANKLTQVNQKNNGRVVPVIKLFKSINGTLSKDRQLSGYHIESLAISAFENYGGSYSHKEMLMYFTKYISENINDRIQDRSGQSIHVDDYLGEPGSKERDDRRIAVMRLYRRMEEADEDRSTTKWKYIME